MEHSNKKLEPTNKKLPADVWDRFINRSPAYTEKEGQIKIYIMEIFETEEEERAFQDFKQTVSGKCTIKQAMRIAEDVIDKMNLTLVRSSLVKLRNMPFEFRWDMVSDIYKKALEKRIEREDKIGDCLNMWAIIDPVTKVPYPQTLSFDRDICIALGMRYTPFTIQEYKFEPINVDVSFTKRS